jgi:hypothetical protein
MHSIVDVIAAVIGFFENGLKRLKAADLLYL